jgi:hypothetical protein
MAPSLSKYWAIAQIGFLVFRIRLLLYVKSLPEVVALLSPGSPAGNRENSSLDDLIYYVDRWLELFPYNVKGNCFPRALALYWLARRSGYPVSLHCGVKKEASTLEGHAWLTLENRPFHEASQQWRQYAVTFSYPSDPPSSDAERRAGSPHGTRMSA